MSIPRAYMEIEVDGYGTFEVLGNCTQAEMQDLIEGGLMAQACGERAEALRIKSREAPPAAVALFINGVSDVFSDQDARDLTELDSPDHAIGCALCQQARERLGRFLSLHFKRTPPGFDLSTPERAIAFMENRDGASPAEAVELVYQLISAAKHRRKEIIAKNLGLPSAGGS